MPTPSTSDAPLDLTLLKIFYQRIFPFKEFHRWLSYGAVHDFHFHNREFSFTLASETYIRFQSFKSADDLKAEITRLCPVKIDIGAVYNIKPKESKSVTSSAFVPVERELVFDIDMTDYDEIRTCCSGANICRKCWNFMTISIRIIDRALREDLGFVHILWVYSGRRGVHCWVSDERARKLTAEARRALIAYLEVVRGGENMTKKVNLRGNALHPSIATAYDVCSKYFAPVLLDQMRILSTPERWSKVIQLVPDETARARLETSWAESPDMPDRDKWKQLVQQADQKGKPYLNNAPRDIVLQYTYPRLDANVSIGLNHLLKSPFCVHPKTGRVCVPIDPKQCHEFDPFQVPTLDQLIRELDDIPITPDTNTTSTSSSPRVADCDRTSLKPYMDVFRGFLGGMTNSIRDALRHKRAEEDKKLMF